VRGHRNQALWYAFIIHRISGIALALFLPAHFYVLALTLKNRAALDEALVGPKVQLSNSPSLALSSFWLFTFSGASA